MSRRHSLLRNTGWNAVGMAIPIIAALVAIPPLIRGLGVEKFGIFAVAWVVMGYFALFDLGMGRATTKFAAEHLAAGDDRRLEDVVWTSLHLHALLGIAGGALFALITPWLTGQALNIPPQYQPESKVAFLLLAASIPFIVLAACLRGLLEAADRFDRANQVRIGGSLLNYLAPLALLPFTNDLAALAAIMAAGRVLVLAALLVFALEALPQLRHLRGLAADAVRPLFAFGGWVTISSLTAPIIMVADRLFIAGFFTMVAVTYYVTPYEIVTKLWLFSASLMGALFPVISKAASSDPRAVWPIIARSSRYLVAATVPAVACVLVLGREFLHVWVGESFALQSTAVAKWLAVGVLFNVVAQSPITAVQAAGRPDLVAKLQLVQLPIFLALAWVLLHTFGTVGVAMAWSARVTVEALAAALIARRLWSRGAPFDAQALLRWLPVCGLLAGCWVLDSVWRDAWLRKLAWFVPLMIAYLLWQWRSLLTGDERDAVKTRLRGLHGGRG
jgi:O-antigen/teichoic acid export membrane protein